MTEASSFGPDITSSGVTFRLWAPAARRVELIGDHRAEMQRTGSDGWFAAEVAGARPGARYQFRIDQRWTVPDPASRFQPDDAHGPSEVVDQDAFQWQTCDWTGRPWHECIFLELHIGTFTREGNFRAAIERLDHIAAAGFTAIELMPVADFPGRWNWGYDGVLLYAPDSAYGRPDDLKALVDAAHARGLMVFLDAVYNHFGPDGNYLARTAPQFFSEAHTPWGHAINYENPVVRRFAVENALFWLREYRFDGLRLDAVHAIAEPGRTCLLRELSEDAGRLAALTRRHIHLVLENDANQAALLDPVADPPAGKYRAQWNDDFHHAFHVLLTGEAAGYYRDYRDPPQDLRRSLAEGFAYQGQRSLHRSGAPRGEATAALPATAFVNFLQNHDQIGNRALGERLAVLAPAAALDAALAVTLLSPAPPLMFMGDEWRTRQPFPFFCDFKGDLANAVREGRRKEFAEAYARHRDTVPDPLAPETVKLATLDWDSIGKPEHAARLDLVRKLLAARKEFVVPRLPRLVRRPGEAAFDDDILTGRWRFTSGETLTLAANLSDRPRTRPAAQSAEMFWGSAAGGTCALGGSCRDRGPVMPPPVPSSTYRLQLSRDFGFDAAAKIVPYLKALGISHLYASPFLTARPGSDHGYDVVDFRTLNPEFGGEEAFARLSAALRDADIGLILDFVPNHMAVGSDNALWLDVLEWGPRSPHAASFDISWELLPYKRSGGVLLPVLGRPYGDALTAGEIELKFDPQQGSFSVRYFDRRFPINPQRYNDIITTIVGVANETTTPAGQALLALVREHAAPGRPTYAQAPALKAKLAALPGAAEIIARGLAAYRPDREGGVNLLHRLLERQHYRLADWRLAVSAINYRRFFDINELAGVRVEDAATFRMMHELVLRLIAEDRLHGLRLDHIDGLFDPAQYARRLRQAITAVRGRRPPVCVIAEKILADGETMPALPGVAGTTGYEWLNTISRLLVDARGRDRLDALWRETEPGLGDFRAVLRASKERVLNGIMASEFNVLAQLLSRIAAGHYSTRDYAPDRLRSALRLYVLEFPVYRTYVTASGISERDRTVIERAIAAARKRWQGTDADIFDFLRDALTLDLIRDGRPYSRPRVRQFGFKMQQFTGPMAAKSLEDTALYRYHALLGLNEVGGDPSLPALSIAEFHARMRERAAQDSQGLTATATHDTKRGEDARARILSLSEIPELWAEHVALWREINARLISRANGRYTPSTGHEYMIYQALIGAWPYRAGPHVQQPDAFFAQRFEDYAIKAAREGKLETNWLNPDERYEEGLQSFVRGILDAEASRAFLASFTDMARRAALLGALNSLSQLVLKATMPGVPDFYQGTELWDLALVDPDNRRPVDFSARQEMLAALPSASARELAENWHDGRIKIALTHRLLKLRAEHPDLFRSGAYEAAEVTSSHRNHVIAFKRSWQKSRFLVIVGRHFAAMTSRGEHWPAADFLHGLAFDHRELGSASGESENLLSGVLHGLPMAIVKMS